MHAQGGGRPNGCGLLSQAARVYLWPGRGVSVTSIWLARNVLRRVRPKSRVSTGACGNRVCPPALYRVHRRFTGAFPASRSGTRQGNADPRTAGQPCPILERRCPPKPERLEAACSRVRSPTLKCCHLQRAACAPPPGPCRTDSRVSRTPPPDSSSVPDSSSFPTPLLPPVVVLQEEESSSLPPLRSQRAARSRVASSTAS